MEVAETARSTKLIEMNEIKINSQSCKALMTT